MVTRCASRRRTVLALAEKQHAALPRVMGHRLTGTSLMWTGDIAEGTGTSGSEQSRFAITAEHDPLATHIGKDYWVAALADRSVACGFLAIPRLPSRTATRALKDARDFGQRCTVDVCAKHGLQSSLISLCGNYANSKCAIR